MEGYVRPTPCGALLRVNRQELDALSEAAFATDARGVIVAWNRAAEDLLGKQAQWVIGNPCARVLTGCDRFGRSVCGVHCQPLEGVDWRTGRGTPHPNLSVRLGDGSRCWLMVVALPAEIDGQAVLLHVARQAETGVPLPAHRNGGSGGSRERVGPDLPLSPREVELLELLARGCSGAQIGAALCLAPATVRNHIQHILQALGVHSRLEAAAWWNRTVATLSLDAGRVASAGSAPVDGAPRRRRLPARHPIVRLRRERATAQRRR